VLLWTSHCRCYDKQAPRGGDDHAKWHLESNFLVLWITTFLYTVSQKQTQYLPITSPMLIDFQNSFTVRLSDNFATNLFLHIAPHFKYVATLPCEIWMSEKWWQSEIYTGIVINDKSQGIVAFVGTCYVITNLPFNLLVKEFLKLTNTPRNYRQNGWSCHMPHSPYTFVLKDAELTRKVK